MSDILHRFSMSAPRDEVYRALSVDRLLASFSRLGVCLRMLDAEADTHIAWRCTEGPPEWIGTDITIDLEQDGGETVVSFAHKNWSRQSPVMATCATHWAWSLLHLKRWVETAEPEDVNC